MAGARCDSRTVVEASLDSFMWTPATRRRHSREHLRYASDVSDEEWALFGAALAGAVP